MRTYYKSMIATVLAATSIGASAQISNLGTETKGWLDIRGQAEIGPVVNGPNSDYRSDPAGKGAGYAAFSDITGANVFFESGSMSAGRGNGSKSITEVSFDVTGTVPGGQIDRVVSTVFESTFGFFVGDFDEFIDDEMLIEGCTGVALATCARTTSGDGFSNFGRVGSEDNVGEVARTSFSFEILYDDVTIRKIGGSISMIYNIDGSISFVEDLGSGVNELSLALVNFGNADVVNYAKVYEWDRTSFEALLNNPIEFGETAKITYRITTETSSMAVSLGRSSTNMIVGFACFSDPFGRGGGRSGLPASLSALSAAVGNAADATCDDYVLGDDEVPRTYALEIPVVRDGTVYFGGAVPEPATWAMFILGFGLVGGVLRRGDKVNSAA